MRKKDVFFKAFLAVYAVLLIWHAWSEIEFGFLPIVSLLAGLLIAFLAHAKKGYVTIFLLAVHMTVEWSHNLTYGAGYDAGEIILQGIHIIFDIVFLVGEFRRHKKGALPAIVTGVAFALFAMSFLPDGGEHSVFPLETIILGGILGCVGAHLFERSHSHTHADGAHHAHSH